MIVCRWTHFNDFVNKWEKICLFTILIHIYFISCRCCFCHLGFRFSPNGLPFKFSRSSLIVWSDLVSSFFTPFVSFRTETKTKFKFDSFLLFFSGRVKSCLLPHWLLLKAKMGLIANIHTQKKNETKWNTILDPSNMKALTFRILTLTCIVSGYQSRYRTSSSLQRTNESYNFYFTFIAPTNLGQASSNKKKCLCCDFCSDTNVHNPHA